MKEDSVNIILPVIDISEKKSIFPSAKMASKYVKRISKETLAESLTQLTSDVGDILSKTRIDSNSVELESISIAAEITVDGGIQWIGCLTAGISNAITLNFRILSTERNRRTKSANGS